MVYELRIFTNIRILIGLGITLLLFGAYTVFAQEEEPNIAFPVTELGNCANKAECKAYCDEVDHMVSCIEFAERNGLMHGAELQEAKKVAAALRQGAQLPGGCTSKESCEAYCQEGSHIEECVEFGIAAGFIPAEEAEEVRRLLPLMKEGRMPGGCREREECEAYCSQEQNVEECTAFFVEAGFMSAQEAEMFRKTGGTGPGGCKGEEECEAYCNNPANQEACFAFAKEYGLIPEHELQNIQEGIEDEMRACIAKPCEEFFACLESVGGASGGFDQEAGHEGEGTGGFSGLEQEIEAKVQSCVQQFEPPAGEEFHGEFGPPENFEGFHPEEGEVPEEFREEFERQQQEFQRQFQQYEQAPEGFQPPEGFEAPEGFHEGEQPPEPPSESRISPERFLGAVVEAMKPGLQRLFPFLAP